LKYSTYGILVLVAVVLTGTVHLAVGGPTSRPATQPATQPAKAPQKIYRSIGELVAEIPAELTKGSGKGLSSLQCRAVNKWLSNNIPSDSLLVVSGKFASSSKGYRKVSITFKLSPISIHGKKMMFRANAEVDSRFAESVAKFKTGKRAKTIYIVGGKYAGQNSIVTGRKRPPASSVTAHGKIVSLGIVRDQLCVRVSGGGLGGIPVPKSKPKAKAGLSKQEAKAAAKTPNKKAGRNLKLAETYLQFGKKAKAIEILKGIVADYPKTTAAKSAASKLEELQGTN
jgi:hypothetical protein